MNTSESIIAIVLLAIFGLAVIIPLMTSDAWVKAELASRPTQEELAAREKGMSMDDYRYSLQCEDTCIAAGYQNWTYVMRNSLLAWSRECWCFGGLTPARVW